MEKLKVFFGDILEAAVPLTVLLIICVCGFFTISNILKTGVIRAETKREVCRTSDLPTPAPLQNCVVTVARIPTPVPPTMRATPIPTRSFTDRVDMLQHERIQSSGSPPIAGGIPAQGAFIQDPINKQWYPLPLPTIVPAVGIIDGVSVYWTRNLLSLDRLGPPNGIDSGFSQYIDNVGREIIWDVTRIEWVVKDNIRNASPSSMVGGSM